MSESRRAHAGGFTKKVSGEREVPSKRCHLERNASLQCHVSSTDVICSALQGKMPAWHANTAVFIKTCAVNTRGAAAGIHGGELSVAFPLSRFL